MIAIQRVGSVFSRVIPYNLGLRRLQASAPLPSPARQYSSTTSTTQIVHLPDGRDLAYATYGTSSGHPIFYLHGFPGSRLEAGIWHDPARQLGATVIGVDRPGIGLSTPQPGRTVLSHADDIRHRAKHLGHSQYSVLGISGGGPYALACAASHSPSALQSVTLVCGMGPAGVSLRHMRLGNRALFAIFRYAPWLARVLARVSVAQLRNPKLTDAAYIAQMKKRMSSSLRFARPPPKDLALLEQPEVMRIFLASAREHFRQGMVGWMEEGRLMTSAIGFELGEIDVPVGLWYGTEDINVPLAVGREIEKLLPEGRAAMHVEHEAHASLLVNCRRKILEDVLKRV